LAQVIKGQFERDRKLVALVTTMEEVYSFVDTIQALPNKLQVLENIVSKILKQTVECAIFIRQYTGHGFGCQYHTDPRYIGTDIFTSKSCETDIFGRQSDHG
jgi:hypothetical protein